MQDSANDSWKLFKASGCSLRLKGCTKEEVFEELVDNLVKSKQLDATHRDSALQALAERESVASTGVGQNVAIPHVQIAGIESVVASLSIHAQGVSWNAVDGEPVNIFFTILRPKGTAAGFDPERHLTMMRWVSTLGRTGDFRNFAQAATTRTELVDLLKEMAAL